MDKEGIPYVRFDGKMSAKRRQETIARFSVPIKEDNPPPATQVTQATASTQGRPKRQTRRTRTNAPSDAEVIVLDDDDDGDFVVGAEEDDDDDDFIVSDDDRPTTKKGKGKAKGTGKSRTPEPEFDEVIYEGVNPKVMLISLKAGALGLNLTVANNVYL